MNAQTITPQTQEAQKLIQTLVNKYYYTHFIIKDLEISPEPSINIDFPTGTPENVKTAVYSFVNMWQFWWNVGRLDAMSKVLTTLSTNYDPIANYDKTSDIIKGSYENGDKVTVTPSGTKTNTHSEGGKETTTDTKTGTKTTTDTYNKTDTTTGNVTTYENTAYRNDDQTTVGQAGTITSAESFDNYRDVSEKTFVNRQSSDVETYNQYKTETEREPNTFTKNIHNDVGQWTEYTHDYERTTGNIGVTTTQQMLESEIELRKRNIIDEFITMFANDNLFYC